ncbi:HNH endonuclease [Psychrobacillus sp. AK 1817]|uniref:HNH endonuclease n=1 Tax=Psychrobacillus sp. AK 1817 TaxID=2303505 RepID=UPI0012443DFA|nr:HNH endonuclease signature motif containing protein [Psychrobacillus sp. AK 1817]QEY22436.1 HNH endonuclease [Psychrobacillus sp. AK 1817]
MYKKCSKCKESKSVEKFSKDKSKSDGLTSACKECNNYREKRRRENGGDFTKEQKLASFKKYGKLCRICGNTSDLQVDHKLPQTLCEPFKASSIDNAWVLCKRCNIAKADRILLEVIETVPNDVLGPMLLREYAKSIAQHLFETVKVTIGNKQYTEVKVQRSTPRLQV